LTTRVRRIRENPGDSGINAFAGRLDDGGDAQQQQIRDSFRMAREAAEKHGHRLVRWTLALPVDLSAAETKWWDGWKQRQEAEHGVTIELRDKDRLDTLLLPPAYRFDAIRLLSRAPRRGYGEQSVPAAALSS